MRPSFLLLLAPLLIPMAWAQASTLPETNSAPQSDKPADKAPLEVDYALFVEQGEPPLVRCKMTLWNVDGPMELSMPEGSTYIQLDEPLLEGEVEARTTQLQPVAIERTDAYRWRIEPEESTEVELSWVVPVRHRDVPAIADRDAYEWPYIAEDHAFLPTAHFLLRPDVDDKQIKALRVRIFGPSGWPFRAPWKELRPNFFQPQNLRSLSDDILLGGKWQVDAVDVAGMDLSVAFAPGQKDLRSAVQERIGALIAAQVELFGGTPIERYLFVFGRPDMTGGLAGSPKANSMTLCVSSDLPPEVAAKGLSHLIAHEFFHVWQQARCAGKDELRFVSEGFTDWFAYRTALRTGQVDPLQFQGDIEGILAKAETSMAKWKGTLPLAGGPDFFEGGFAYDATYAGGLALALALDVGLAAREGDAATALEFVLQDLWNDPRWDSAAPGEGPGLAEFYASLEKVGGTELTQLARAYLDATGKPDLVQLFSKVGLSVERGGTDAAPEYRLDPKAIADIAQG